MSDFDILTTTRSWVALPWDYNSCIGLRFRADGSGDMVFGSCQTIHAEINFRFSLETQFSSKIVDGERVYNDELTAASWALNSAVECHPHTVEVIGSNPIAPTILRLLKYRTLRPSAKIHFPWA